MAESKEEGQNGATVLKPVEVEAPESAAAVTPKTEQTEEPATSPPEASEAPAEAATTKEKDGPVQPGDHDLHRAIAEARQNGEALGVPKLLAKIKEANPTWALSDKRLRKFLASHPALSVKSSLDRQRGGEPEDPIWLPNYNWQQEYETSCGENVKLWPTSGLDDHLILECKSKKVEPVRFPEGAKGSGLVTKEKLVKGAQVFKEDAYVWVPGSKPLTRAIMSGTACAYCGRYLSTLRSKNHASCPHHSDPWHKRSRSAAVPEKQISKPSQQTKSESSHNASGGSIVTEKPGGPEPCYQRFCNRVCASKSAEAYGPLVCPQRNPQYVQVLRQADAEGFCAPHIVFKLYASMLMANERGEPIPSGEATSSIEPTSLLYGPSRSPDTATTQATDASPEPKTATNGTDEKASTEADAPNAAEALAPADPPSSLIKKSKKSKSKKKSSGGVAPETQNMSYPMMEILERISGLASVSERARRERSGGVGQFGMGQMTEIRFGQIWKTAWHIVVRALHINTGYRRVGGDGEEVSEEEMEVERFWEGFWKRRLPGRAIADWFGVDKFMIMLGMVSLNQESDNGLYLLHARLNHSCEPNCAVQKQVTDDRSKVAPSTIYIITKRDVEAEEELTLSYVPPDMPVEPRRKRLFEEYSFSCWCARCRRELQEQADARKSSNASSDDENGEARVRTLEDDKPGLVEDREHEQRLRVRQSASKAMEAVRNAFAR